jgi:pyridoxal phosphate enzyme (YggS family)
MSNLDPSPSIADARQDTLNRIAASAKRDGRLPTDITLVAVSKQQSDERVQAMLETGHSIFGENRVQEAQKRWSDTFADWRDKIELRLIGPLQTNKAVDACQLFDVIETLDRVKLAKALVAAAEKTGKMPRLFVQVNTGEEEQKAGVAPDALDAFIKTLRSDYTIEPEGLMCIPPAQFAAGPHFALLKNLAERNGLSKLSMGMSGDFETAIELGATHVRVGSALFGARG